MSANFDQVKLHCTWFLASNEYEMAADHSLSYPGSLVSNSLPLSLLFWVHWIFKEKKMSSNAFFINYCTKKPLPDAFLAPKFTRTWLGYPGCLVSNFMQSSLFFWVQWISNNDPFCIFQYLLYKKCHFPMVH